MYIILRILQISLCNINISSTFGRTVSVGRNINLKYTKNKNKRSPRYKSSNSGKNKLYFYEHGQAHNIQ